MSGIRTKAVHRDDIPDSKDTDPCGMAFLQASQWFLPLALIDSSIWAPKRFTCCYPRYWQPKNVRNTRVGSQGGPFGRMPYEKGRRKSTAIMLFGSSIYSSNRIASFTWSRGLYIIRIPFICQHDLLGREGFFSLQTF